MDCEGAATKGVNNDDTGSIGTTFLSYQRFLGGWMQKLTSAHPISYNANKFHIASFSKPL